VCGGVGYSVGSVFVGISRDSGGGAYMGVFVGGSWGVGGSV